MKQTIKTLALGLSLVTVTGAGGIGCGGDDSDTVLGNDPLIILQRPKRNDMGDIFQYTSYKPGAKLVKLDPPTADGVQTVICCDKAGSEFANVDISGYDISFDAKQIVFSGKLAANQAYGLFILNIEDGSVEQLPTDPGRDYSMPIFLPGDKILYTSNAVVEAGAPQHSDEYERGTTLQLGRINTDGTGDELGPRNLSHRTFPTLASDGRIMFTQWDHLGPMNAGHLMFANQDMTNLREGFGKEGTGASNSTLKAHEIAPGRFVAIATARNRTVQAGALIDIRLGDVVTDEDGNVSAPARAAEATATYRDLTPDVPHGNEPSVETVGRYYDAYPLNAKDKASFVVSWADGPVESEVLGLAGLEANFGVYLYAPNDRGTYERRPILDDPEMWDIFPRQLKTRTAPPIVASATDANLGGMALLGSMNVYESSRTTFEPNSIYGVRISEGFSSEEGFPRMFGSTMFEGMATLGVAPVRADGSWAALVPSNVPVRIQTVDSFGMANFTENVWFSARAGESRFCGGCHEDRTGSTVIDPGLTDAIAAGPTTFVAASKPRAERKSNDYSRDAIVGVAWNGPVQKIFDDKCVSCHNGTPGAANPSYTITNMETGQALTWTFDLRGDQMPAEFAELAGEESFTRSYFSIVGPDMEAIEEGNFMLSGSFKVYMNPENARGSLLLKTLNPVKQFPNQDTNVRAFQTTPHMNGKGPDLTADEFYQLILAADNGASFYARENNPGVQSY
ncbi:MAG: hypothetical protein SFX73_08650 [Kofleriaceae bacterium]|nr:hypothetical protein [Kofleriaceae bacterium]